MKATKATKTLRSAGGNVVGSAEGGFAASKVDRAGALEVAKRARAAKFATTSARGHVVSTNLYADKRED